MAFRLFETFILTICLHQVQAFPDGAPESSCLSMYPRHSGIGSQEGDLPCTVVFQPLTFKPGGDPIDIEIASRNAWPIRGIQIGANRKTGNPQEFVGQFIDYLANKTKVLSCYPGFENMITHKNSDDVLVLKLKWKPPEKYVGDVLFRITIVQDYSRFWVAEQHTLKVDKDSLTGSTPVPPLFPEKPRSSDTFLHTIFDTCGIHAACFYYPRYCKGENCIAAVSFEYREKHHDFYVQIAGNGFPGYVAVGLSYDKQMGNDATVSCIFNDPGRDIQQGYNPGHVNEHQMTRYLDRLMTIVYATSEYTGSACSFLMPSKLPVYRFQKELNGTYKYQNMVFNTHYHDWYLMLAWGETLGDKSSQVIAKHKDMPAVTYSMINLEEPGIYYGSAFPTPVRVHGCLMIIAWVLVAGIVTVISRHFRESLPKTRLFGTNLWFQVHRGCAILLVLMVFVALIVNFVYFGPGIRGAAGAHASVGLVVFACLILQMLWGFLRPAPDSKRRRIYYWTHLILGQWTHFLAAVTMFLAFNMDSITKDLRNLEYMVLAAWIVVHLFWHLFFEIYNFFMKSDVCSCLQCKRNNIDISMKFQCFECLCACKVNPKSGDETQDTAELLDLADDENNVSVSDSANDRSDINLSADDNNEISPRRGSNDETNILAENRIDGNPGGSGIHTNHVNDDDDICLIEDSNEHTNPRVDDGNRTPPNLTPRPGQKFKIFENVLLLVYIIFMTLFAVGMIVIFLMF